MLGQVAAVLDAVSWSDVREDDPIAGRERFYRRDLDPERSLRVVVDFRESPAFVVTAFAEDNAPGTLRLGPAGQDRPALSPLVGSLPACAQRTQLPRVHAAEYGRATSRPVIELVRDQPETSPTAQI
jgi:hypothetical protein